MEFGKSDEQQALFDSIVRFAQNELNDDVIGRDARHEFGHEGWQKCADFGIPGLPVVAEYGGQDADPVTIAIAMEALGYGCADNGLIFALNAHMWSCVIPLVSFGTDEQKRRYLPGLCDGSMIGVQGMTEPESGSDAFSLTTRFDERGGEVVLNGAKTFISNAPVAGLFIVFARATGTTGISGLQAFIVERDTPGLTVGAPFRKMGLHTAPMSELILDDCVLPASNSLGPPGSGMAVFNTSMDWERSFILASSIGTMQRRLEESVAYAKQRRQFGSAIGDFQAVSHRLVDMKVRLDAGRLLLYHLAWLKSQGRRTAAESAATKLFLSDAFLHSSLDALQVHGGYGYMEEAGLERDVRDAVAARIYSGTSDMQRNIIARSLGL